MSDGLAKAGIHGAYEGALKFVGNPELISRTHFARFLVESGVCKDTYEVFRKYLTEGKPGYVPHRWATLKDAVHWITGAGGIAVVAHPGRYKFTANEEHALFLEFQAHGGRAIEVVTGSHAPAEYIEYATRRSNTALPLRAAATSTAPMKATWTSASSPGCPGNLTPFGNCSKTESSERRGAGAARGARPRFGTHPCGHRPGHPRRGLLRDARHCHQDFGHRRADRDGRLFRYAFQAVATTAVLLPTRGTAILRTSHPKYPRAARRPAVDDQPLRLFQPALHAAGRVHRHRADRAAGDHAVRGHGAEGAGVGAALVAGGRRLLGTLVILRPGGSAFSWALLLPIGLVMTNAWFQVLTSKLAQTENPLTMHFYTGWVGALLASCALPFVWTSLPSWHWWALLCLMGLMGTVGHFMLILGYQRAQASTITPYLYAQIAFAMLGGWLIFSHVPDAASLVGMGLIAVCGAAGAWLTVRERRIPIEPAES